MQKYPAREYGTAGSKWKLGYLLTFGSFKKLVIKKLSSKESK
jgi:hypothetical protein